MQCGKCKADYEAINQHSTCPECGAIVGTDKERDLDEILAEGVRQFEEWVTTTADAVDLSQRDRDYKDGMQWSPEEVAELDNRGQPVIVKNHIFKKVNFLLGMEVRNRVDPRALPRTPSHGDDAEAMTDALRYICDEQDFDNVSSRVWDNVLVEGYGGAVVEHEIVGKVEPVAADIKAAPTNYGAKVDIAEVAEDNRRVEVRLRHVPWDRLWYDVHSRDPLFADASHLGISTWMDLDEAIAEYGKRNDSADNFEEVLRNAVSSGNDDGSHEDKPMWADSKGSRKRVRISERFYKHVKDDGSICWYVCHYTKAGFLVEPKPTGYLDEDGEDVCPLLMVSAFVTREGMRYGLVRHMIGPQDEINKRSSKALHWLSVDQTIAEAGAVLNPDEARVERTRPDGWVEVQRNALVDGRIRFERGDIKAQGELAMLQEAKTEIDTIGPEIPQIGSVSTASSGRALMMRQQIGSLELAPVEDNHKRWKRMCYRHMWYRVRQFWTEEKWMRVRDDANRTGFRFVGINRKMQRGQRLLELMKKEVPLESATEAVLGPEAQVAMQKIMQVVQMQLGPAAQQMPPEQMQQQALGLLLRLPKMQEVMTANDVAHLDVDIILDETPDTSILQQEEYENLAQLVPAFLQAQVPAQPLLELMLEASQLRNKRKLLEMLHKPPDPMQVQMQQTMQKLQAAGAQAQVQVQQSQAQLNQAKAAEAAAKAQVEAPKAQADIEQSRAQSMVHAAGAGEKAGGAAPA